MTRIFLFPLLIISCFFPGPFLLSQPSQPIDTTGTWELIKVAEILLDSAQKDAALDTLRKASGIYQSVEDWTKTTQVSQSIAKVALRFQDVTLANEQIQFAQNLIKDHNIKDDATLGDWLFTKGLYFQVNGLLDSSEFYLKQSLPKIKAAKTRQSMAYVSSLDELGITLGHHAQYQEALDTLNEGLKLILELEGGESKFSGDFYNNIGYLHGELGDYDTQLEYYQKSLALALVAFDSNHVQLGVNYNNIGYNYAARGLFSTAISYFEKSLKIQIANNSQNPAVLSSNYLNLGFSYGQAGDYGKAFHYLEKALAIRISTKGEAHPDVANTYHNLAFFYGRMRDHPKENANYQKALKIRTNALGLNHPMTGVTYTLLGQCYISLNELDSALFYLEKGLEIVLPTLGKTHLYTSTTYFEIGNCYAKMGELEKAEEFLLTSIENRIANVGDNHPDLTPVYLELGKLYLHLNRVEESRKTFDKAIFVQSNGYQPEGKSGMPKLSQLKKEMITFLILGNKAHTYDSGNKEELIYAQSLFQLADSLIVSLREDYKTEKSRKAVGAYAAESYVASVNNSLALYELSEKSDYLEMAFSLSEKGKSVLLNETINESNARISGGIPDDLLERENTIRSQRSYHDKIIFEESQKPSLADSSRLIQSLNKQFELTTSHQKLIDELEMNYPEYYRLKYDNEVVSLSTLQKKLEKDEGMVVFSVGEKMILTFLITSSGHSYHRITIDKAWKDRFEAFINHINNTEEVNIKGNSKPYFQTYSKTAYALYQELLEPILKEQNSLKKLIIVPSSLLGYLPFDILLTQPVKETVNYASLPYLIKDFQIRYAYSATLFSQAKKQKTTFKNFYVGLAPQYYDENEVLSSQYRKESKGIVFGKLAHTGPEVENASTLLGGELFMGSNANETTFRNDVAGKYSILHLASHAWVNDDEPLYSGLMFSMNPQAQDTLNDEFKEESEDGFLYAYELYNMQFEAELAVLSACETGRGKLQNGEGIMNLARAFSYAGCSNVVMSLWRADDVATRELMNFYFQFIKDGLGKSEALRQAKLQMLTKSSWKHPHYWSAFVQIGDDEPIEKSNNWWLYLLGITVLLGFIFFWYNRKKK